MKINQTQDMLGEEKTMSKKLRKRYTFEPKRKALKLWGGSGKSAAEIERTLGLVGGILYHWKSKLKKGAKVEVDGSAAETAEIRRLKKELKRVTMERDTRRKAISIFSKTNG